MAAISARTRGMSSGFEKYSVAPSLIASTASSTRGGAAHQRDLRARPGRPDAAQHLEPVDAGHVQVEQHEVHVTALQHLERRRAIGGLEHLEAFADADLAQQLADLRVVIDEQ